LWQYISALNTKNYGHSDKLHYKKAQCYIFAFVVNHDQHKVKCRRLSDNWKWTKFVPLV